jgi:hypothetical protein
MGSIGLRGFSRPVVWMTRGTLPCNGFLHTSRARDASPDALNPGQPGEVATGGETARTSIPDPGEDVPCLGSVVELEHGLPRIGRKSGPTERVPSPFVRSEMDPRTIQLIDYPAGAVRLMVDSAFRVVHASGSTLHRSSGVGIVTDADRAVVQQLIPFEKGFLPSGSPPVSLQPPEGLEIGSTVIPRGISGVRGNAGDHQGREGHRQQGNRSSGHVSNTHNGPLWTGS